MIGVQIKSCITSLIGYRLYSLGEWHRDWRSRSTIVWEDGISFDFQGQRKYCYSVVHQPLVSWEMFSIQKQFITLSCLHGLSYELLDNIAIVIRWKNKIST